MTAISNELTGVVEAVLRERFPEYMTIEKKIDSTYRPGGAPDAVMSVLSFTGPDGEPWIREGDSPEEVRRKLSSTLLPPTDPGALDENIFSTAHRLFRWKGFANVSHLQIIREAGDRKTRNTYKIDFPKDNLEFARTVFDRAMLEQIADGHEAWDDPAYGKLYEDPLALLYAEFDYMYLIQCGLWYLELDGTFRGYIESLIQNHSGHKRFEEYRWHFTRFHRSYLAWIIGKLEAGGVEDAVRMGISLYSMLIGIVMTTRVMNLPFPVYKEMIRSARDHVFSIWAEKNNRKVMPPELCWQHYEAVFYEDRAGLWKYSDGKWLWEGSESVRSVYLKDGYVGQEEVETYIADRRAAAALPEGEAGTLHRDMEKWLEEAYASGTQVPAELEEWLIASCEAGNLVVSAELERALLGKQGNESE